MRSDKRVRLGIGQASDIVFGVRNAKNEKWEQLGGRGGEERGGECTDRIWSVLRHSLVCCWSVGPSLNLLTLRCFCGTVLPRGAVAPLRLDSNLGTV